MLNKDDLISPKCDDIRMMIENEVNEEEAIELFNHFMNNLEDKKITLFKKRIKRMSYFRRNLTINKGSRNNLKPSFGKVGRNEGLLF